jgi:hypothetical protein
MSEVELALEVLVDVEATHDWLRPNDLCRDARRKDWCFHARMKEVKANLQHISELCRDGEAYRAERQRGAPAVAPPPDGLLTPAAAARKLGCSIKTLNAHVATGALHYVAVGHGKTRMRRMYAAADLDEFIANQTRKDVPCPSTRAETVARRISTTTSKCEVIGFTGLRSRPRGAKPKR